MLVRPVGLIITHDWQVDMSDKMVKIDGNLDQVYTTPCTARQFFASLFFGLWFVCSL